MRKGPAGDRIPLAPPDPATGRRAASPVREASVERRLLIAEDDRDLLDNMSRALATLLPGWRIETVTDGMAALAALDRTPTAIVADEAMPGLRGLDLLAIAERRVPGCRRILITALVDRHIAIRAVNEKLLDAYFEKPFRMADLAAALDDA